MPKETDLGDMLIKGATQKVKVTKAGFRRAPVISHTNTMIPNKPMVHGAIATNEWCEQKQLKAIIDYVLNSNYLTSAVNTSLD